jgi:ankyrin repeat protein
MPRISINNLPSLKLFSFLRLHSTAYYQSRRCYTLLLTNESVDLTSNLFGGANQDLVSRMTDYNSEGIVQRASASVQCADWIHSLAGDRYPNLGNASDSTTFEIDVPSELSSISRAGDDSRLLLSIIYSAANNLLSKGQASRMLPVILQNSNRKLFQALIAGQSPATKAIARTFLLAAIESLDCSLVRPLLDTGISPDSYANNSRRRPLQIAIRKQSTEMMKLLLHRGADVNSHFEAHTNTDPETPLEAAAQIGRLDLVQLLLQAGAHINGHETGHGGAVLMFAAQTGQLDLVQFLLDAGAGVDGFPDHRRPRTALQAAAHIGNIKVVRLLLSYGAGVNVPGGHGGRTALESAAHAGNVDITQLLLFYGAIDVAPALYEAGRSGHNQVISHIVHSRMRSHGIVNDIVGSTALKASTLCGDFELVKTLLGCGVSPDPPLTDDDYSWRTALQIAAGLGDLEIAELLIDRGADVDAPAASYGVTALQAAASENHMQLVQTLLNWGANVNAPASRRGATAIVAAAQGGHSEMVQFLLDCGAIMNMHDLTEIVGHVSLDFLRSLLDAWALASGGKLDWPREQERRTALVTAAEIPDIGKVQILLDYVEYAANDKSWALRCVINDAYNTGCTTGTHIEILETLLASGAEVGHLDGDENGEDITGCTQCTALEIAAFDGNLPILRLLLEHWKGPTAYEKSKALQTAANERKLDAARLLLEYGADINATRPLLSSFDDAPRIARTALQAAAGNSDLEMVRCFLDAGADVESKNTPEDEQVHANDEQATALQFAAIAGSMSIVTLLIERGADVNAPAMGKDGRTALEGAAEHGRLDLVQLLLNLGVEVAGSRAIEFAREEGHDGVVALLEESS